VTAYEQSLKLTPTRLEALANLGDTYHELGQAEAAKIALVQAQAINGADPKLHRLLGAVYLELGQKERALAEYEFLKRVDPPLAESLADLIRSASS
jgi:tetratricopeptide (TPR) repeat protein